VKVGSAALDLNVVKEQYHEGEYYWGRFDTKGKVKLVVKTSFDLSDVKVISNGEVDWSVKDNALIIKAKGPFKAVVEPKGRIKPLLLFADKPEGKKPEGGSVKYFAPGVHNVGVLEVTDGQVVYLDEGAVVNGAIHAVGQNILIIGPSTGVIEMQPSEIRVDLEPAQKAVKGVKCSIAVPERLRRSDKVYIFE
jgi:hypothetical protein